MATDQLLESVANAFPCDDGSVIVSFYVGEHEIDVRVYDDGSADFEHYSDEEDFLGAEGLTLIEATDLLQERAQSLCLSGSFIQSTGIARQSLPSRSDGFQQVCRPSTVQSGWRHRTGALHGLPGR